MTLPDLGGGADTVPATSTRWTVPVAGRRVDVICLLILLVALTVRLHLAATVEYIHDEVNNAIPLSKTISLEPGHVNLPMRGENHGALPAYVAKASSVLFGTTPFAYRSLHVLLGMATIVLIFLLTREWYGPVAARWAAALLAFNEYSLDVSSRVTAHAPHLFLIAAALYAFSRFLRAQRVVYLYAAGAFVGLAFYCKEHSALLLPVFLATLALPANRRWLRSPHVYLAGLVFVLLLGPDLYWNMTTDWETAKVTYGDQPALQAHYQNHLRRLGGIALSPYPSMFYGRSAVRSLYLRFTGRELYDETAEYHSMNVALGVLLLGAVLVTTFRLQERDRLRGFLLLLFWGVFGFFSLIKKGDPPGRLGAVSWMWVEFTILPAVILAGTRLAGAAGKWRAVAWVFGGAALLYAASMLVP